MQPAINIGAVAHVFRLSEAQMANFLREHRVRIHPRMQEGRGIKVIGLWSLWLALTRIFFSLADDSRIAPEWIEDDILDRGRSEVWPKQGGEYQ